MGRYIYVFIFRLNVISFFSGLKREQGAITNRKLVLVDEWTSDRGGCRADTYRSDYLQGTPDRQRRQGDK